VTASAPRDSARRRSAAMRSLRFSSESPPQIGGFHLHHDPVGVQEALARAFRPAPPARPARRGPIATRMRSPPPRCRMPWPSRTRASPLSTRSSVAQRHSRSAIRLPCGEALDAHARLLGHVNLSPARAARLKNSSSGGVSISPPRRPSQHRVGPPSSCMRPR